MEQQLLLLRPPHVSLSYSCFSSVSTGPLHMATFLPQASPSSLCLLRLGPHNFSLAPLWARISLSGQRSLALPGTRLVFETIAQTSLHKSFQGGAVNPCLCISKSRFRKAQQLASDHTTRTQPQKSRCQRPAPYHPLPPVHDLLTQSLSG